MDVKALLSEQKAGQLVIAETMVFETDQTLVRCVQEDVGNFLISPVVTMNHDHIPPFLRHVQSLVMDRSKGIIPFLATENEGGEQSALGALSILLPCALAISASNGKGNSLKAARIAGEELLCSGFNLSFSPSSALCPDSEFPRSKRSPGDDPYFASRQVKERVRGLSAFGIAASAGRFPFLASDVSASFPSDRESALVAAWCVPFLAAIKAGAKTLMVAPITFSAVDRSGELSVFSPEILSRFVRNVLGFKGLIVADLRECPGSRAHDSLRAIRAGADMVIPSGGIEGAIEAKRCIVRAVLSGDLADHDIESKAASVLRCKSWIRQNVVKHQSKVRKHHDKETKKNTDFITRTSEESIARFKDEGVLPLSPSSNLLFVVFLQDRGICPPGRLSMIDTEKIIQRRFPRAKVEFVPQDPDENDCKKTGRMAFERPACVILANDIRLKPGSIALVRSCVERNPNTVLCAMGSALDALADTNVPCILLAWEYTPLSLGSILSSLVSKIPARGWIPISSLRRKAITPEECNYKKIIAKYPVIW